MHMYDRQFGIPADVAHDVTGVFGHVGSHHVHTHLKNGFHICFSISQMTIQNAAGDVDPTKADGQ